MYNSGEISAVSSDVDELDFEENFACGLEVDEDGTVSLFGDTEPLDGDLIGRESVEEKHKSKLINRFGRGEGETIVKPEPPNKPGICPHCGARVNLRQVYCLDCGKRCL